TGGIVGRRRGRRSSVRIPAPAASQGQQRERGGQDGPMRPGGRQEGLAVGHGRQITASRGAGAARAGPAGDCRPAVPAATLTPMEHDFTWVADPAALLSRFETRPGRIGLDTEFIRERTWWPHLALAQMAVHDEILLLDMQAPGMPAAL